MQYDLTILVSIFTNDTVSTAGSQATSDRKITPSPYSVGFIVLLSVYQKPVSHALYGTGSNVHCTELYIAVTLKSRRYSRNGLKNHDRQPNYSKRDGKCALSTCFTFHLVCSHIRFSSRARVLCTVILSRT